MELTKNFSLEEFVRSSTARMCGIDNTPNEAVKERLHSLCVNILQPLRDEWGSPIVVSSGYRCGRLNRRVGGVSRSDHLYGCAADIKTLEDTPGSNRRLFELAVKMMRRGRLRGVKQIVDEYGYDWIHISWQDGSTGMCNQVLHVK